ncbi:hypothetical protein HII36_05655 [Nonomuraea sp. NN258]|uniref:hypothetical protein n=1 Tax=Nonomuraea antri TaxID=2730852 RepID=UPI001568737D|nr:hypothetical protein [Nonomuraea antri]NRQ31324.1 hypothetical protein [Nonomuraea antri]
MTVSEVVLARRRAMRERKQKIKLGTWRGMVDALPARQHVQELRTVWLASYAAIASTAQVAATGVKHLVEGTPARELPPPARIGARMSDALLTVTVDDLPDAYLINPVGATRRLRALAVQGWPTTEIADVADAQLAGLKALRIGTKPRVTVALNRRIREAFDVLIGADPYAAGLRKGTVTGLRKQARERGWHPAEAWADAIDDPRVKPWQMVRCSYPMCVNGSKDERRLCTSHLKLFKKKGTLEGARLMRNSQALLEDARFIVATEPPINPQTQEIDGELLAARLGTTWEALERLLNRAELNLGKLRESV